jgi:hypothetical protein
MARTRRRKLYTRRTNEVSPCSSQPPSKSTCPVALLLSSTAIAAAYEIPPHDIAGSSLNVPSWPLPDK